LLQDAVIAGQDKNFIAVLAWPVVSALKQIAGEGPLPALCVSDKAAAFLREKISAFNKSAGGSSGRVARIILMAEPPSIDGHEITDKGYVNQRATLDRRAELVNALYAEPPGNGVIVI
jgi:feruloyl-CoA synthase